MTATTSASDVVGLTERVFTLLGAGQYEPIRDLMTASAARTLTRKVVLGAWAATVAEVGSLVACRHTRAELSDGTVLSPDEAALGLIIGSTVLECEAGDWVGRLALDADHQIIGLLVVPPDRESLPF